MSKYEKMVEIATDNLMKIILSIKLIEEQSNHVISKTTAE